MASRGSITIEIVVKGYPPNAPDLTFQESMIVDIPQGDDTESNFRKIVAVMRNILPGPAISLGLSDTQFDPERKLWTGIVVDHAAPQSPEPTPRSGFQGE